MNLPTPAIVTQLAARRLSRTVLLLLGMAYVLPGLLGRQPWYWAELGSLGVMLDMAQHQGHWWHPQVLGQAADLTAWLPYWLGALSIKALPFLPAAAAARVPFGLLLLLTLVCTWYAMYHLARLPAAQPVSFAFGGEASPTDYACALADTALLALVASLGLAQLGHESAPSLAQLACGAMLLYGCARLASPYAEKRWFSGLVWWTGTVGLALSGAPWLGLGLGLGWLLWLACQGGPTDTDKQGWWVWAVCVTGTVLAAALAWKLQLPRRIEAWTQLSQWLHLAAWRDYTRLLLWFTWPVGPLALWTLWRWRHRLHSAHVLLPLWFAIMGMASAWLLGHSDRALLMALPGMACLAAFAMPTLSRSVTALIDWFAMLFFSACAVVLWFYWLALHTGWPAKPAANVMRLAPGFEPSLNLWLASLALLATVAWLRLLGWRLGRHKPALWKGLVLSAGGATLCWVLLMTLWLPALNYGLGLAPIAQRMASATPTGSCLLVHGLNQAQITALQYHGQLDVQRPSAHQSHTCQRLVVDPEHQDSLAQSVDMTQWELLTSFPRLRINREHWLLYARR